MALRVRAVVSVGFRLIHSENKKIWCESCRGCPYTAGTIANGCLAVFYDVCGVFGALTAVCGGVDKITAPPLIRDCRDGLSYGG